MIAEHRDIKTNSPPISDTSPLALTVWKQHATTALAVTAATPVIFASDGASSLAIPHDARFVRIHPLTGGNAIVRFQGDTKLAGAVSPDAGSMQVVLGFPEIFQLPVGVDRVMVIDITASGAILITWGA